MSGVTQQQIAKKLGISQQAVAFGLSDNPRSQKQLNAKTRRRVLETAERLGYVPHFVARSLKAGKTNSIGVVGHFTEAGFGSEKLHAMIMEAQQMGYKLLVGGRESYPGNIGQEKELIKDLLARRVDGLIIFNEARCDSSYYNSLQSRGVALVFMESLTTLKDLPTVTVDLVKGMYEATQYLFDLGHRDIAYAAGSDAVQAPGHRYGGFRHAFEDAGFPIREGRIMDDAPALPDTARLFTQRVLRLSPRPTAIMYVNDEISLGGIHSILEKNLCIPKDISVVGFDDLHLAKLTWPSLTTVRQPVDEVAREAFRLLKLQMEENEKDFPLHVVIPPRLMIRDSTGRVPHKV